MLLAATAICLAGSMPAGPYAGEPPALSTPMPALAPAAPSAAGFAPTGWRVERQVAGDLNKDGRRDIVVIVRGADPACVVSIDGPQRSMDTNPRLVIVAFGDPRGYRLQLANASIIPRVDDPYMDDPLDGDALAIRDGVLRIGLTSWRSMGGWSTFSSTFAFRWDGSRFRLIGFDRETLQRNSGETEGLSVNYLTGRAKVVTGSMQDDVAEVTRRRPLRVGAAQTLEAMGAAQTLEAIGDGLAFEPALGGGRRQAR